MPKKKNQNVPVKADFEPAPLDVENAIEQVEEVKPWVQWPDESDKFYNWFHHWLTCGPNRSVLTTYNYFLRLFHESSGKVTEFKPQPGISLTWRNVMVTYDWKARATAYDAFQRAAREREFEQRRREYQEKSWSYVDRLHARVDEMFKHPITEKKLSKTTENEITTVNGVLHQTVIHEIVVKPAGWRMSDIPRLLEAADELERTATAIEVDKILQDLEGMDDEALIQQAEAGIKARRG